MKFSQLPKQYQDLINNLPDSKKIHIDLIDEDNLSVKFLWSRTYEGSDFWQSCKDAATFKELPEIN